MPKYRAIRNSFGYLGTYWHKGDVVEADTVPNRHFVPYGQSLALETKEKTIRQEAENEVAKTVEKVVRARRKKE